MQCYYGNFVWHVQPERDKSSQTCCYVKVTAATVVKPIVFMLCQLSGTVPEDLYLSAVCVPTECELCVCLWQDSPFPCRWIVLQDYCERVAADPLKGLFPVGALWEWRTAVILRANNDDGVVPG